MVVWGYGFAAWGLHWCSILKAINGDKYDYCFIIEHSSGHGHLWPDGLNIERISRHYRGKQPMMRDSIILGNTYLDPFQHDNKLKAGATQSMLWVVLHGVSV